MDDRVLPGAIVIGFIALLLVLMYLGWRGRRRRQSALDRPLAVPESVTAPLTAASALYVATTYADRPLDRIAVAGLGFRARATVTAYAEGVALSLAGEKDAWLPAESLMRVDRATSTIDRVVEPGGLVRISWLLGGTLVDSYLRVTDSALTSTLISTITDIIQAAPVAGNEES